jgi:hypothetical protein
MQPRFCEEQRQWLPREPDAGPAELIMTQVLQFGNRGQQHLHLHLNMDRRSCPLRFAP